MGPLLTSSGHACHSKDKMKITLIDGAPLDGDQAYQAYLADLIARWSGEGRQVIHHQLRELEIPPCTGCWSCWWKTPGLCSSEDAGDQVRRDCIHSDLVVLASPLIVGFPSALLKTMLDKLIPLAHPYIALDDGECRHRKRYPRYPALAALIQPGEGDEQEDLDLVERWFRRTADQFHSTALFYRLVGDPMEEVAREADHL